MERVEKRDVVVYYSAVDIKYCIYLFDLNPLKNISMVTLQRNILQNIHFFYQYYYLTNIHAKKAVGLQ